MRTTYLHAVASLDSYRRHQFDLTNGWEGHPPASEHVVVVSHRPRPEGWHPEASYHFATSVEEGMARAQELAGDGEIGVGAGDVVLHLRYPVHR
jgi:hypothetical protein